MNPTPPLRLIARAWFADGQPLIPLPPGSVVGVTRQGEELRVDIYADTAAPLPASGQEGPQGIGSLAAPNRTPAGTERTTAGRGLIRPPF